MEFRDAWEPGEEPRYVKRALVKPLVATAAPVVVLEGAHGTGKTSLVKNEAPFKDFYYVTLANEAELGRANEQPEEWLARLPRPVVIDEAHRAEGLLEAVQRAASAEDAHPLSFVLVASEALPHEEDDESDEAGAVGQAAGPAGPAGTAGVPKAAGAAASLTERFTLFPLTQAEIYGRTGCIIDDLFDGDVAQRFCSFHTRSDLRTMMRIGGFPTRVMRPVSALSHSATAGLLQQMGLQPAREDAADPDADIDRLISKTILEKLLTNPGISLGVDAVAAACSVDAATLSGYLEMLQDRFLIHRLTMLDKKKQPRVSFAKTRVYPVDTALAIEALQQVEHDITVEPPVFAKALRTLCLDQLVPAVQWASVPTEYHHWKKFDHRMREVDLVLKREDRLVGITIRNSMAARHDTVGALRLLAQDKRFVRGFIIYMGMSPRRLTENIWAIPVSALWEGDAFFPGLTNLQN